ncbi:MAG TPA: AMP-binding protein [Pseudonocardia sp.]|nr:AMP-binding protein [Pseudonocardia sp.]
MLPSIEARRTALRDDVPTWQPRTLHETFRATARRHGDRPLVLTDDRILTYAQADDWVTALADGLAAMGVRPGDRVGLLMANYLEFVPVKFALAAVGAVAIPFNYLYRRDELAYVLGQSRCSMLITMTGFAGLDYLEMLDDIASGWSTGPIETLPELRGVVLFSTDGRGREGVPTLDDVAEQGRRNPGTANSDRSPHDVGDILYTSGTTGSPKGVMVSHDAVLRTAYSSALTRAYEDGRRILFSLPCYHMFGYVEGLLSALFVGGAIVPQTSFDPERYFAGIERHRATEILCVPTMTVALLEHPSRTSYDLSSAFAILSGAAPAPVWVWERVRDDLGITEITTGYGMTEAGGAMTLTRPEDPIEKHSTTVGAIKLAGAAGIAQDGGALCHYDVVDPSTGADLPEGSEGELAASGPTIMQGFWEKPVETRAALVDGRLRSGDVGIIGDDGYLRLTGRVKELYKSGGELVMPKEIEELLSRHPGISQAFAVGVPDDRWGEAGCVWVVPEADAQVSADDVLALCKDKLARFKVPKHVFFCAGAELPTTPTGKVQKFELVRRATRRLAGETD